MAIPQAAPAADPSAPPPDPTAGAAAAPDAGAPSGGFVIELHVKADGTMSVGVEPMASEAAETTGADSDMGGGGGDGAPTEEDTQPVPNLAAAFKLIKEIVTQGGQMADAGAGQDQMSGGYS